MKKTKYTLIIGFLMVTFISCQKIFLDTNSVTENKKINFQYLWNEIDKKYSFFELKGIDWYQIKAKYEGRIQEEMSDEAFFDVMAEMLNELRDGHTNLVSPFNVSRYDFTAKYPAQIHFPLINKLFPDLKITGMLHHTLIDSVNISYIRFAEFADADDNTIDYVLDKYRNAKGIIFDIRDNGGGAGVIVNMLLSRFTDERKIVGYEQMRNGYDHNDFSEPSPIIIEPKGTYYNHPMIVLTDRGCYSASTYFSLSTKSFDNITMMGDTTGGGAGMPNGGELPNGWTYRFSTTRVLDIDKRNYAEEGVAPDIIARFDWSDLSKDEVIEQAIERLR